jgi:transposase InsO family protein
MSKKPSQPYIQTMALQMKAKSLKKFLRDLGVLNDYSRPHIPVGFNCLLKRLFQTAKQEEVYRNEYSNHLEARDSLSGFFDYYNHRWPHQGIGNVTPYDKLTGGDEEIIKMRKIKSQLALTET